MGGKSSHQRTVVGNSKSSSSHNSQIVTFSKSTSLHNQTDTSNLSALAQIPEDIINQIILILGPSESRNLAVTSHLFLDCLTHTVAYLSNKNEPVLNLVRLYDNSCAQFMFPRPIQQPLVLPDQLVEYEQSIYPRQGLAINYFKELHLLKSEDFSKVKSILISWPNKEFDDCNVQLLEFLEFHKFPSVKKLVLNNLLYSPGFLENLIGKFKKLEYLKIASFDSNSEFNFTMFKANLSSTTFSELEITLKPFNAIELTLPTLLKKATINIFKGKIDIYGISQQIYSTISQDIYASQCTILEFLKINTDLPYVPGFHFHYPQIPCLKTLISYLKTVYGSNWVDATYDWYSQLEIIHIHENNREYQFLSRSRNGDVNLDKKKCPNCREYGVLNNSNKFESIWKKQQ